MGSARDSAPDSNRATGWPVHGGHSGRIPAPPGVPPLRQQPKPLDRHPTELAGPAINACLRYENSWAITTSPPR